MKEVWEKQYKEKSAPWNYDGFDEDFRKFLKIRFSEDCTVIDLGCGNGSQAHHIEKLGFKVTATDIVNALAENSTIKAGTAGALAIGVDEQKALEKEELDNMKKEISEIKEMLAKITSKL